MAEALFTNYFEKKLEDGRLEEATVRILGTTDSSKLKVVWEQNGQQAVWFDGEGYQQMLVNFRLHLQEKTAQGFLPKI